MGSALSPIAGLSYVNPGLTTEASAYLPPDRRRPGQSIEREWPGA